MTSLVTGATGLVGSHLTRQLLEQGSQVRIFRRPTSSLDLLGADAAAQVEHAVGDLSDTGTLGSAMKDVSQVYHTAAMVSFSSRHRDALFETNVRGTARVVNAALHAGVERVVLTSSMAAFGRPEHPHQVSDETTRWHNSPANSPYAESKHLAELEIQRGVAEGLDAVIVNPALIFGTSRPAQNTHALVELVRDGKLPAAPPGGTNVVDVRDVAAAHRLAMQRGRTGERYFIGSMNLSWRAILDKIAGAFDVRSPRYTLPAPAMPAVGWLAGGIARLTGYGSIISRSSVRSTARTYRYDNTRAVEELGCTFRPFAETMSHMAAAL